MWENLFIYLKPYLNAILIGISGFLLAFILSQITRRLLARPMGEGWSKFVASLVALGVGIWTIKLILDSTGAAGVVVILVTVLTGAFAIGSERFASDLVAGINLFVTRSYAVGDFVSLAGYEGKVKGISLMTTTLENLYGDWIHIRNSDAMGGTVINYSIQPGHLIAVKIPLPINQDLNVALSAIEKAIKDFSPELSDTAYQSTIVVEAAEAGYVTIEIRAYVTKRVDYGPEKTRLFLLATNALMNAGLQLVLRQ
jgi:small conductance mechanosensitive channel